MLQLSPARLVLLSVIAVVLAVVLAAVMKMGFLDVYSLAMTLLVLLAGILGWFLFALARRLKQRESHMRQMRFVADRFQALVRALPGGYCLFSPQGLLREEYGVAAQLGLQKLAQFEDLAAGIKEGPALSKAYRRLQETGEDFDLDVTAPKDQAHFRITGRRFSISRDGPKVDVLWVCDHAAFAEARPQALASAAAAVSPHDAQSLLDAIPFPVWGRAKDLNSVLCNRAYAKAVDASIEDVLREQHELMSQTARGGIGRALAANALNKNEKQNERRHVIVAGKRRLLEITELPFRFSGEAAAVEPDAPDKDKAADGGAGDVVLLGFAVDVTAEEEKETELQRHLAAHHEVMEHLGSAIAIYGRDTKLEFYNSAYQKLWEADEAFLNGKPTFAEILEDLRARRRLPEQADFQHYKKERAALFTSLLEPQEDQMFLPDGTTLRILAVPHPFGGIMFVHENVTDRLALESNYNTLIAVQRETLDNLAEGIAVFGPDGKLRLFNPAFARIWKLEADYLAAEPHVAELLEQMKPLFNFGDNWGSFKGEMVSYALDRNPRTGRIERADQTIIQYLTVPLPDGAVLNSYLDVSDSVRVEQALRASNAALAAADRLKSDFVANVSYQLRTPLNTIAGFADILTEQYFGTLNDKQLEYTRTIKAESEKLSRLINDVLDLALIEAGRMALNRKPVAAADLLNAAKQMTAEWARQQKLEIFIDCPSDIGPFEADENRLKQVLFNLIGNAIKYTPEDGRITLEARRQDGWIVLTVADTGIGISESDRDRVFGKFERANPQARQSGAGLGLSLVKSFVELHGGRVEIASSAQKGTRISCFIPQKAPEEGGGS
ncbi:MAG: ATP-binding protein [Alphaproteobacteria bacterium]|nr:ATP-binding protein [Alphaproteobacteria bacterium]